VPTTLQPLVTDAILSGNVLSSSFTTISVNASATSPLANCTLTVGGSPQPCDSADAFSISPTEVDVDVTIYVATDTPQLSSVYDFSAIQLPCSLVSLTPTASTALNCTVSDILSELSCVVVWSTTSPSLGFVIDASENCQYATMQRLDGSTWMNVSSTNTQSDIGLNQYRLVYSTISNPPQIVSLSTVETTLGHCL
jgi:hypothetical protein